MGHNRLGDLPRTRRWKDVVDLLRDAPADTAHLGAALVEAADSRFLELAREPTLAYPLWLLARIAWASRSTRFLAELGRLGIQANPSSSALDIIGAVGERVRREALTGPPSGHLSEFAVHALRSCLTATVATQDRSLFDSGLTDVQRAFRTFSTQVRFGELARRFFADFMSRALLSFVEREIGKHVGGAAIPHPSDSAEFRHALDTHTWEAAAIVERFAGEWYSKHNWQTGGDITPDEAQGFVAQGLRKLRGELKRGARLE